jgi:hypothetical protein
MHKKISRLVWGASIALIMICGQAACGASETAGATPFVESSLSLEKVTNRAGYNIDVEFHYQSGRADKFIRGDSTAPNKELVHSTSSQCLEHIEIWKTGANQRVAYWNWRPDPGQTDPCGTNTFTFQNGELRHGS